MYYYANNHYTALETDYEIWKTPCHLAIIDILISNGIIIAGDCSVSFVKAHLFRKYIPR